MEQTTIKAKIKLRTMTEAEWDAVTDIPLKGEMLCYSDVNKIKVGDGVHLPKDLKSISSLEDALSFTGASSINHKNDYSIVFGKENAVGYMGIEFEKYEKEYYAIDNGPPYYWSSEYYRVTIYLSDNDLLSKFEIGDRIGVIYNLDAPSGLCVLYPSDTGKISSLNFETNTIVVEEIDIATSGMSNDSVQLFVNLSKPTIGNKQINDTQGNFVFGRQNSVQFVGQDNHIIGNTNYIGGEAFSYYTIDRNLSANNNLLFGSGNELRAGHNNFLIGVTNSIQIDPNSNYQEPNHNFLIGESNYWHNAYATHNLLLGFYNSNSDTDITTGSYNINIGSRNTTSVQYLQPDGLSNNIVIGNDNSYCFSDNIIIGHHLQIPIDFETHGIILMGQYNYAYEDYSNYILVVGGNNQNVFTINTDGSASLLTQGTNYNSIVRKEYVDGIDSNLNSALGNLEESIGNLEALISSNYQTKTKYGTNNPNDAGVTGAVGDLYIQFIE